MTPTYDQIAVATRAFGIQYRKECVRRRVPEEKMIAPFDELDPDIIAAMKRCVTAALIAADPENVKRVLQRAQE